MSTNSDIIRDALGMIGVVAETESMSAEQGAHGLRVLNDMLLAWEAESLGVTVAPQSALTDDFPLEQDRELGTKANLAMALAPYYGREASPYVQRVAQTQYARFLREGLNTAMEEADMSHLPAGQAGDFIDVTTGQ